MQSSFLLRRSFLSIGLLGTNISCFICKILTFFYFTVLDFDVISSISLTFSCEKCLSAMHNTECKFHMDVWDSKRWCYLCETDPKMNKKGYAEELTFK